MTTCVCYTLPFYWSGTFFHQESITTSRRRGDAMNCNHMQGCWKLLKGGAAIDHNVRGCGVGSYIIFQRLWSSQETTPSAKKNHWSGRVSYNNLSPIRNWLLLPDKVITPVQKYVCYCVNAGKSKFNFCCQSRLTYDKEIGTKSAVALTASATAAPMDLKQWNISHTIMYAEMLTGPRSGLKNPRYM